MDCGVCSSTLLGPFGTARYTNEGVSKRGVVRSFGTFLTVEMQTIVYRAVPNWTIPLSENGAKVAAPIAEL